MRFKPVDCHMSGRGTERADGGIILFFHTHVHAWILFHHILKSISN